MPSSRARAAPARIFVHVPLGDADVQGLALPDDVGEGLHRFFQRRVVVVAVGLVEVHVVGAQPGQGTVDGFHDVLAGQPAVIPAFASREVDLGEDLDALAPLTGQRFTECLLRAGAGVGVGGVEGGNAQIDGLPDAGRRRVLVDLLTVGDPVPIGQFADVHAGGTKFAVFHACGVSPYLVATVVLGSAVAPSVARRAYAKGVIVRLSNVAEPPWA